MRTIGWGIVQIPLVEYYRVCFCWKRALVYAVSGTGWKLFIQNTIRILLLVLWGMPRIDFEIPQTSQYIIGLYVELGMLGVMSVGGVITIISSWFVAIMLVFYLTRGLPVLIFKSIPMLYPALILIPASFIIDFVIKATCYGPLFLFPEITEFGVFSLIEVWWRNFTQMYCWVAIISFIYNSKGKIDPFEVKKDPENPVSRIPSMKSPFSRSSTLSRRGRRSFLLKAKPKMEEDVIDADSFSRSSGSSNHSTVQREEPPLSDREDNDRSALLHKIDSQRDLETPFNDASGNVSPVIKSTSDITSFQRQSKAGAPPSQPRYKRIGGFVPEVLRAPSNAADNFAKIKPESYRRSSAEQVKSSQQPSTLPKQPLTNWLFSRNKKSKETSKEDPNPPSFRPNQSILV